MADFMEKTCSAFLEMRGLVPQSWNTQGRWLLGVSNNALTKISDNVDEILSKPLLMKRLSEIQNYEHENAPVCHICEGPFYDCDIRVADHDHLTGFYRGAAHHRCNLIIKTVTLYHDSFRFISDRIEKLASYLDNSQKQITKSYFNNNEEFELLTRKGVFPYDYLNSWETEETSLPKKEVFTAHERMKTYPRQIFYMP
ncbi:hypothetical protein NQ318_002908 [Aromia moschata]|uniref:Uncharacterized protein n=1 Tax=Aromia moschata TaxID=1265417 RepID=A0AAV8X5U0_9CUCU|nr:hypothetical protein NQ318_002908 [Aromia moschata]